MTIPYTKNTTWADGSGGGTPVTAAKLNTIETGISDAHLMPAVRVYHNTTQSLPNAALTALAFNSERYDTAGGASAAHHDTSTNNSRLTCLYAGKYVITGQVVFSASTAGAQRLLQLRVNGSTVISQVNSSPLSVASLVITTEWDLAVNDYVELIAYQDTGSSMTLTNSASYSPEFMMSRVA